MRDTAPPCFCVGAYHGANAYDRRAYDRRWLERSQGEIPNQLTAVEEKPTPAGIMPGAAAGTRRRMRATLAGHSAVVCPRTGHRGSGTWSGSKVSHALIVQSRWQRTQLAPRVHWQQMSSPLHLQRHPRRPGHSG